MPTEPPRSSLATRKEDHDIVFFSNAALAQIACRVASLADLLAFHRSIKERGLTIRYSLNHATEFSFYFDDPEGHLIEIYWATACRSLTLTPNRWASIFRRRSCSGKLIA